MTVFSALDFDIRPGQGLGPFDLGTSLYTLLSSLRSQKHIFPQVELKYDPDIAASTPVIIHIRPHISLVFSGLHQRLSAISVGKLREQHPPLTLRYRELVLSSSDEVLRQVGVSRAFGPTFAGDLKFPGIWFGFDEDGVVPSAWSGDKQQEVKRVIVSQMGDRDALDEVEDCSVMDDDVSQAIIEVHKGVTLHFYSQTKEPVEIQIGGTTAQDLIIDLGTPVTHYKDDDRPALWDRARQAQNVSTREQSPSNPNSDYFYNYFNLGVDFLLAGDTHIVKKIVLHTNIPGTALFQRYKRCPWEIEGKRSKDDDGESRMKFHDRLEQISRFLGAREPPPATLLDRTDDDEGVTLPSPVTRLYSYDGITLEATESSQVTCVMLF